jgi:hypothetical protein
MTKLDLLLQQAEVRARRASSARRTTPSAVSYDPRQCSLARRRREGTTHALVRALMRAGDVVAYSILTARWSATPPESWKQGEPLPIASNAPRSGDRRRVQPPPQGRDVALERDADGRCTDLVLMVGVDGMAARMLR